jgi:hypothetical protein
MIATFALICGRHCRLCLSKQQRCSRRARSACGRLAHARLRATSGGTARPGEIEVDQPECDPAREEDVVEVRVVVADQAVAELRRYEVGPSAASGVERRRRVVIAAKELGDAYERLVGERPVCVGLDRRFARQDESTSRRRSSMPRAAT